MRMGFVIPIRNTLKGYHQGHIFLRFAKPGKINNGMIAWEKQQQHMKTAKAKRWMHACGRKDFNLLEQIKKRHLYLFPSFYSSNGRKQ